MDVLTVKVALEAPAGTITLIGTLAAPLLLESITVAPPAGAGPFKVTMPVEDCRPPVTLIGFSVSEVTVGRGGSVTVRVSVVVFVKLPEVPLIVTVTVPVIAALLAASVNVLTAVAALEPNDGVTPPGRPEADKLTLPPNPFCGVILMVPLPMVPCAMVRLDGDAERKKFGMGVKVSEAVWSTPP